MDHNHIAQVLMEHPNTWVIIHTDETSRAHGRVSNWRHGKKEGKRPKAFTDAFDFKVESCGYGTYRSSIYARYTPPAEEPTEESAKKRKKKKAAKKAKKKHRDTEKEEVTS